MYGNHLHSTIFSQRITSNKAFKCHTSKNSMSIIIPARRDTLCIDTFVFIPFLYTFSVRTPTATIFEKRKKLEVPQIASLPHNFPCSVHRLSSITPRKPWLCETMSPERSLLHLKFELRVYINKYVDESSATIAFIVKKVLCSHSSCDSTIGTIPFASEKISGQNSFPIPCYHLSLLTILIQNNNKVISTVDTMRRVCV